MRLETGFKSIWGHIKNVNINLVISQGDLKGKREWEMVRFPLDVADGKSE